MRIALSGVFLLAFGAVCVYMILELLNLIYITNGVI